MSNSIGEKFRITSFGSSHGKALGAVVDGCPANLELTVEDIQKELDKRKPGTSSVTTPRKEGDEVQILSGIFEGKTDGTPITGVVFNKNQHSKDYSMFKNTPRPSHGDFGWMMKYGNYDYNGGGRGSGRVTIGHVIGGAIAKKLLKTQNIEIPFKIGTGKGAVFKNMSFAKTLYFFNYYFSFFSQPVKSSFFGIRVYAFNKSMVRKLPEIV
jgi:chorismate synthase